MLGLVETAAETTPYALKRALAQSIGNFWSVPHSQVYAELDRLARAGLLSEHREKAGRRRKRYSLTARGREELAAWRGEPTEDLPELRDLGLLKLFLGAEAAPLARGQLAAHRAKLAAYEEIARSDPRTGPRGPWQALGAGIAHERVWVRFWSELAGG